jgi:hypothetical protein
VVAAFLADAGGELNAAPSPAELAGRHPNLTLETPQQAAGNGSAFTLETQVLSRPPESGCDGAGVFLLRKK